LNGAFVRYYQDLKTHQMRVTSAKPEVAMKRTAAVSVVTYNNYDSAEAAKNSSTMTDEEMV